MLRRLFTLLLLGFIGLSGLLLANYARMSSAQIPVGPVSPPPISQAAASRLSEAVRIPTVTGEFVPQDFLSFLHQAFPQVFRQLDATLINGGGLVLHWRATNTTLRPILFIAHYDVVPANQSSWTHPPFSGEVDDTGIWGRGTLDDKLSLMGLLEAVELLLAENAVPERDIYLAFGHDEETGGQQGAARIAEYFAGQQLTFEFVLDEGMLITDGILPFVRRPVALIGVAEKGYADIELHLAGEGGHASMPGQDGLLYRMSEAISRIHSNPMSARLTSTTRNMLTTLAAESDTPSRIAFSNLWLFEPLVLRRFEQAKATHAAVNTTFAATQILASDTINALPDEVTARLNVRMLPGTTSTEVVAYLRHVIADQAIDIRLLAVSEPTLESDSAAWGYRQLARSIRETFGEVLVAPALVIPATDARHYQPVALQTYRFLPISVTSSELAYFHGNNEHVGQQAYRDAIRFYYQCLKNSGFRQVDM